MGGLSRIYVEVASSLERRIEYDTLGQKAGERTSDAAGNEL